MKSKVHVLIVAVFMLMLIASLFGCASKPIGANTPVLAKGDTTRRTWVVVRTFGPADQHIAKGDGFRLSYANGSFILVPLSPLRSRWGQSAGYVVALVKGSGDFVCGKVTIKNHGSAKDHVVKIKAKSADELQMDYEVFDATKSLVAQCNAIAFTHRGRAHAEN